MDLKLLKGEEILDKATYRNIKPVGSRPSNLCRLGIVHKKTKNELPPSCPILSAIGTSFYKLKIFLPSFLAIFTENGHTFANPFRFPEEIFKEDPNLYMASLYVDTLFANVPLDETIENF